MYIMYKMGRDKSAPTYAGWVASSFEQGQLVSTGTDGETLFEEIDGGFLAMWHYLNPLDALEDNNNPTATSALFIPGLTNEEIQTLSSGARLVKRGRNEFEAELKLVLQRNGNNHKSLSQLAHRSSQGHHTALFLYKTKN